MAVPTGRISFQEVADGATITTSNTTPTLTTSSGGTRVASTAEAYATGRGAILTGTATSAFFAKDLGTPNPTCGVGVYHHYQTADIPGAEQTFLQIRDGSGGRFSVAMRTDGKIRTIDASGATVDQVAINGNAALTDGHWYYHQISATKGTGTGDGQGTYTLYDVTTPGSPSLINSIVKTNINMGTADYTQVRWGKTGAGGNWTCKIDEIAWLESSMALIDLVSTIVNIQIDDFVGISDTDTPQTLSFSIPFGDALGILDALSVAVGRAFPDSVALTDGMSLSFGTGPNDPIGITETFTISSTRNLPDDPVNITDALNAVLGNGVSKNAADNVGITDALVLDRIVTITVNDAVGLLDGILASAPPGTGLGSVTDVEFARLRTLGYTGDIDSMRYQWFIAQGGTPGLSIMDLEFRYYRTLGFTGSLADMRLQASSNYP